MKLNCLIALFASTSAVKHRSGQLGQDFFNDAEDQWGPKLSAGFLPGGLDSSKASI